MLVGVDIIHIHSWVKWPCNSPMFIGSRSNQQWWERSIWTDAGVCSTFPGDDDVWCNPHAISFHTLPPFKQFNVIESLRWGCTPWKFWNSGKFTQRQHQCLLPCCFSNVYWCFWDHQSKKKSSTVRMDSFFLLLACSPRGQRISEAEKVKIYSSFNAKQNAKGNKT